MVGGDAHELLRDKARYHLEPIAKSESKKEPPHTPDNSLVRIGLALHNYHDTNLGFPSASSAYKSEQTGLSWRVHLLPFLGQAPLYKLFHLDEPWDSPHNKTLISPMPRIFTTVDVTELGRTSFHVVVGEELAFTESKGMRRRDILPDGLENTIFAVRAGADKADIWTKPGGLTLNEKDPFKTFGTPYDGGFLVLFGNGTRTTLDERVVSPTVLKELLTRNGGEVVRCKK